MSNIHPSITDSQELLVIPELDTKCEFGTVDENQFWYMFANTERYPGRLYIKVDIPHFIQYALLEAD